MRMAITADLYKCLFLFTFTNSAETETRHGQKLQETCNRKISGWSRRQSVSLNRKKESKHTKEH